MSASQRRKRLSLTLRDCPRLRDYRIAPRSFVARRRRRQSSPPSVPPELMSRKILESLTDSCLRQRHIVGTPLVVRIGPAAIGNRRRPSRPERVLIVGI